MHLSDAIELLGWFGETGVSNPLATIRRLASEVPAMAGDSTLRRARLFGKISSIAFEEGLSDSERAIVNAELVATAVSLAGLASDRTGGRCSSSPDSRFDGVAYGVALRLRPVEALLALAHGSLAPHERALLENLSFGDSTLGELLEVPRPTLLAGLGHLLSMSDGLDSICGSHPGVSEALSRFSLSAMGPSTFLAMTRELIGQTPFARPTLIAPASMAGDLGHWFGLGESFVEPVVSGASGAIDLRNLWALLLDDGDPAVLVARLGSPEGVIDPIAQIVELRARYRNETGRDFWIHLDASGFGCQLLALCRGGDSNAGGASDSGSLLRHARSIAAAVTLCDSITLDFSDAGYSSEPAFVTLRQAGCAVAPSKSSGSGILRAWAALQVVPPISAALGAELASASDNAARVCELLSEASGTLPVANVVAGDQYSDRFCFAVAPATAKRLTLAAHNRSIDLLFERGAPELLRNRRWRLRQHRLTPQVYDAEGSTFPRLDAIAGQRMSESELRVFGNPWRDDTRVESILAVLEPCRGEFDELRDLCVTLRSELSRCVADALAEPLADPLRRALPGKLLILEDDRVTRELLRNQFERVSFEGDGLVFVAATVRDALQLVSEQSITAALVDIHLGPGEERGGIDFLRAASRHECFRGAVVFTGHAEYREEILDVIRLVRRDLIVTIHEKPRSPLGTPDDPVFLEAANALSADFYDIFYRGGTR